LICFQEIPYPGDMDVWLPDRMDLGTTIVWARELSYASRNEPLTLHVPSNLFITPAGMLLSCAALRDRKVHLPREEREKLSYARWVGWTKCIGTEEEVGASGRGATYLPIQESVLWGEYHYMVESIAEETADLVNSWVAEAGIVSQDGLGGLRRWLEYAFREVIRNVPEHSGQATLLRTVQVWPRINRLQVAVYDPGQGFVRSFQRSGEYGSLSAEEAIDLAVRPGVTGAPPQRRKGTWGNSGFGLYVLQSLALRHQGWLSIVTDGFAVTYRSNRSHPTTIHRTATPAPIPGTLVAWEVDFLRLAQSDFHKVLREIVESGERTAGRKASLMSRGYLDKEIS